MLLRKKKKNFPSTFHLHRVFKPNKLPPSRYRSLTSLSRGHHLLIPSLKTILPVKSIRKHHPPRIDGDTPLKTLNRWIGAENSTLPSVGVIPPRIGRQIRTCQLQRAERRSIPLRGVKGIEKEKDGRRCQRTPTPCGGSLTG